MCLIPKEFEKATVCTFMEKITNRLDRTKYLRVLDITNGFCKIVVDKERSMCLIFAFRQM